MPAAKPRPGMLPHCAVLDLGELLGSEWEGFSLSADGFQHPYWRRPFSRGELCAMFYDVQRLRVVEHELRRAAADLESAITAQHAAEERADWYRRQLILESRCGAMLSRISLDTHPPGA